MSTSRLPLANSESSERQPKHWKRRKRGGKYFVKEPPAGSYKLLQTQERVVTMVQARPKTLMEKLEFWYYHYQITTTTIMMEPTERYICNSFFLLFFSLFLYTTIVYLPGHLVMIFHFLLNVSGVMPSNDTLSAVENAGLGDVGDATARYAQQASVDGL